MRMFEERKDKTKETMGRKKKHIDEITTPLAEEITPQLDTFYAERCAFIQYQIASTELEHRARVLRAYEWMNHRNKASRKDAHISEWEQRCRPGSPQKGTRHVQGQHRRKGSGSATANAA